MRHYIKQDIPSKQKLIEFINQEKMEKSVYDRLKPIIIQWNGKKIGKRLETRIKQEFPHTYVSVMTGQYWNEILVGSFKMTFINKTISIKEDTFIQWDNRFSRIPEYETALANYDSLVESFKKKEREFMNAFEELGIIRAL